MFKNNRNLIIIAIIAIVNALGYGIIIPIFYSYSQKFALTPVEYGLLFALFSLCQFLSAPFIGRLSDKYGRKPMLVLSLIGTSLSFFMAAFAPNALILFISRALDGLTAGNIPVASAVISDTTEPKDRAKGFGIIGASFGFGFVFGPAISGLTVQFGLGIPFIIAGVIAALATILTIIYLPETNKHIGQVQKGKIFDFKKLFTALFDKNTGMTLLISFIFFTGFGLYIVSLQPFAKEVLHLSDQLISFLFVMAGVIGILAQTAIIPFITKRLGDKRSILLAFATAAVAFLGIFFFHNEYILYLAVALFGLANSCVMPLIQAILSKEVDEKSQGSILGINSSYMSLGNIIGPIMGGALAALSLSFPFLAGAILFIVCFILAYEGIKIAYTHKQSEF